HHGFMERLVNPIASISRPSGRAFFNSREYSGVKPARSHPTMDSPCLLMEPVFLNGERNKRLHPRV
ncbi:hypothetical protein, partial [Escherichia coli]|uniref:hypothetical protein n=1 Tax=Escherichia coli TaxID=562 RepID=UPI001BC8AF85